MTNAVEQSSLSTTRRDAPALLERPVYAPLCRGILLVEPDVTLLAAETLFLTRSNYSVTPAFSQREIFMLRTTKAVALAILSDCLGHRLLTAIAETVRKQWPLARILVIGRPESVLEDHLYDEQIEQPSDPKQLLDDLERLYKDSWNQRSNTLDWDAKRAKQTVRSLAFALGDCRVSPADGYETASSLRRRFQASTRGSAAG